jgi:phage terminase large subunit-like protein
MPFDNHKALKAINFIELLKHTKGAFRGKNFKLLDWQHSIISDVYGTMNEKNLRQYQYVYLEVPKKNGKSELVAATGLYHTFADGEMKGEIYGCAADRTQASLAFDVAVDMVDQNSFLKKQCKYTASKKELKDLKSGSIYKVLSAESYTKHGLNASCIVFDELHCQPNRDLWDVMYFGAGDARLQPILYVITTAGDDPDKLSIGYEIHDKALKIMSGEMVDPRWYCKVYGIPEDYEGDIYDEELWHKVNPSLGHTIDIDKVRQAAIGARNNPAEEKLFRWLRLNQWVSLKQTGWLDLTLWDSTTGKWNASELIGKKCYAGLDLSSTTDLTGLVLLFPPQDGLDDWRFFCEAWIPEDNMKERIRKDNVPYDRWVSQKILHATPGNVIDYDFVRARIETLAKQYDMAYLCTDPWNSRMLTQQLQKADIECLEVTQNMAQMSPAMKEIERLLKSGMMTHDLNALARWCFGNVHIAIDGNENIKPMKNKSKDRIDVIVALINAMSVAIKMEESFNVYESRGMLSL